MGLFSSKSKNAVPWAKWDMEKACKKGDLETVLCLLQKTVNVDDLHKPLVNAIRSGHCDVAEAILSWASEKGFYVKVPLCQLVYYSVGINDLQIVSLLFKYRKSPRSSYQNYLASASMHKAIQNKNAKMVSLLLANGYKVDDFETLCDQTNLHVAAECGDAAIVRILLKSGARAHPKCRGGVTPLHIAARDGRTDIVRLLIAAGARVKTRTERNLRTALHCAAAGTTEKERGTDTMAYLLRHRKGLDINHTDCHGNTCLHLAAKRGRTSVVEMLILRGAKIHQIDNKGRSALHLAAEAGHADTVMALVEAGATVTVRIINESWHPVVLRALRSARKKRSAKTKKRPTREPLA